MRLKLVPAKLDTEFNIPCAGPVLWLVRCRVRYNRVAMLVRQSKHYKILFHSLGDGATEPAVAQKRTVVLGYMSLIAATTNNQFEYTGNMLNTSQCIP